MRADVENKIAMYECVSELLEKDTGIARPGVLAWLVETLAEDDPEIRRWVGSPPPLAPRDRTRLGDALIGLDVTFRMIPGSQNAWQRVITAYVLVEGGAPKKHTVVDQLDWSDLPEEVREARLGGGDPEVTFKLLPLDPKRD